jgi:hypothetical protein
LNHTPKRGGSIATGVLVMLFGAIGAIVLLLVAPSGYRIAPEARAQDIDHEKVTICHRTDAPNNPYVKIDVAASSADGDTGNDHGQGDHSQHTGPVATSEAFAQQLKDEGRMWGDIIPPHHSFPGLNWDADGMAVYRNHCDPVERDGLLTIMKVCDPVVDNAFEILVNGRSLGPIGCGGSIDDLKLEPGTYTVSETPVEGFATEFGGDCDAKGQVEIKGDKKYTCTVTNILEEEDPGSLTITKECVPMDDEGEFVMLLDGNSQGEIGCGESVFDIELDPGTYQVSEGAGTNTDLGDYTTFFSGACDASGEVELESGEEATCTVTNERLEEEPGFLTITKECVPTDDDGEFVMLLDGVEQGEVGCGESVFDIELEPGTYQVSEEAGTDTDLGDYDTSFGGDCDASGEVEVMSGDDLTCTVTNDFIEEGGGAPETGMLTITKVCVPADDDGEFDILLDGVSQGEIGCGESVSDIELDPGTYAVSEAAGAGTDLGDYDTSIGGACDADGSVDIEAGDDLTCTITNDLIEEVIVEVEPTEVVVAAVEPTQVVATVTPTPEIAVLSAAPTQEPEAVVLGLPASGSGGLASTTGFKLGIGIAVMTLGALIGLSSKLLGSRGE